MAYNRQPQSQEGFKINFQSMPQATEWLIVKAMNVRINAAIMGRNEKISATEQVRAMIPTSWQDKQYMEEIKKIDKQYQIKQIQCQEHTGKLSSDRLNDAMDAYADELFKSIWNLLSRIGKLPQKSEVSEE